MNQHEPKISLVDAMIKKGFNSSSLSKAAGLGHSTVGIILSSNGPQGIRRETAERLAKVLGIPVEDIEWPKPFTDRGKLPGAHDENQRRYGKPMGTCPVCFVQLPTSGICDEHG